MLKVLKTPKRGWIRSLIECLIFFKNYPLTFIKDKTKIQHKIAQSKRDWDWGITPDL